MINTNATNLRKNLFGLLEQTIKFNEPVNVSTKDGNAVILSEEEYNSLMETLYLVSIPKMKEEIKEGLNTPISDCIPADEVEWQMYKIVYTKKATTAIPKLKSAHLDKKAKALIDLLAINPYTSPPYYERLQGDLAGAYSRRINIKHRLVYEVDDENMIVKIISLWTHYEF